MEFDYDAEIECRLLQSKKERRLDQDSDSEFKTVADNPSRSLVSDDWLFHLFASNWTCPRTIERILAQESD